MYKKIIAGLATGGFIFSTLPSSYASIKYPFPYLYKKMLDGEIGSYEGCCPGSDSDRRGGEVLPDSVWNNSIKSVDVNISDINVYSYDRDWSEEYQENVKNFGYKSYNLKKDLGLPTLKHFDFLFEVGYNVYGHDPKHTPEGFHGPDPEHPYGSRHARDRNYSIFGTPESGDKASFYNLYTGNGEKWGICKPYLIAGYNRIPSGERDKIFFSWNNIGIFASYNGKGNKNRGDVGNAKKYLFYFPFSVDSSGKIKKELNIISNSGHLNGKLDPKDIQLQFTFY